MRKLQTIRLGDSEYVIVPKTDYLRLQKSAGMAAGSVDSVDHGRESLARTLAAARKHSGLTQAELADRLGKSQPLVSGAENGAIRVSERYVASVLEACGLPKTWTGPKQQNRKRRG